HHERHNGGEGRRAGRTGSASYFFAVESLSDCAEIGGRSGHSSPVRHVCCGRRYGGFARLYAGGCRGVLLPHRKSSSASECGESVQQTLLSERRQQQQYLTRLSTDGADRVDCALLKGSAPRRLSLGPRSVSSL